MLVKLERRRVIFKNGHIYKTQHHSFVWFKISEAPKCYVTDSANLQWVVTGEFASELEPPKYTN